MRNDTRPEIRFPGFTEDWEERKLIDLVVRLNKSTNSSRLPKVEFEDIVAGEGRLNKDVSQKFDNRKGIEFLPNDILYGKLRPYLKNWLKATFTGVAIGDFWVFRAKKSDSDFIYSLIQADRYQKAANDTSGTKMPRSDWKKVSDTVFYIPHDLKEQQKIGIFFKKLDDTITLHQRKLDLLKETKKGFLQKMFPKNGAKVPEIRFPGFTENWEEKKFKEVINSGIKGKAKAEMSGTKSLYLDTNYLNGGVVTYVDSPRDVENDDVLILWDGSQAGTVYYGFSGALGSTLKAYRAKESGAFLYQQLKRNQQIIYDRYRTPNIPHVVKTFTDEFMVSMPSSEEQQKIGTFFKQLDDTIALHQRKLDLLKETKKGFLQKMFV
ncbi:restriction endonuclease subunit S [Enterococcus faecium]|nr:restriction endonuclease subunit S [Enterococcus faecium]NTP82993.1 restriction endonuclease subunit S [Enterococcus faecium]